MSYLNAGFFNPYAFDSVKLSLRKFVSVAQLLSISYTIKKPVQIPPHFGVYNNYETANIPTRM